MPSFFPKGFKAAYKSPQYLIIGIHHKTTKIPWNRQSTVNSIKIVEAQQINLPFSVKPTNLRYIPASTFCLFNNKRLNLFLKKGAYVFQIGNQPFQEDRMVNSVTTSQKI